MEFNQTVVEPKATRPQLTKLAICFAEEGIDDSDRKEYLYEKWGVTTSKDLSKSDASTLINYFERGLIRKDRLQKYLLEKRKERGQLELTI